MAIHLSGIYVYPLKSLPGIQLEQCEALSEGLRWDRRWMLTDQDGQFISQRTHPQLSQLQIAFSGDGLRVHARHAPAETLHIPFEPEAGGQRKVRVWNDEVVAWQGSAVADAFFSEYLGSTCHLVQMPPKSERRVDARYADGDTLGFADGFPVLILSQASLDALNRLLPAAVGVERFRPNLVVEGADAFAEDGWGHFRIGEAEFGAVKPCSRCVMVNVDPADGSYSKEPLATLAGFRARDGKVLFGMNALVRRQGWLKVSDAVSFPG